MPGCPKTRPQLEPGDPKWPGALRLYLVHGARRKHIQAKGARCCGHGGGRLCCGPCCCRGKRSLCRAGAHGPDARLGRNHRLHGSLWPPGCDLGRLGPFALPRQGHPPLPFGDRRLDWPVDAVGAGQVLGAQLSAGGGAVVLLLHPHVRDPHAVPGLRPARGGRRRHTGGARD